MAFWAYMLRCSDDSYYVGHTDNLEERLWKQRGGVVPGYTSTRLPVTLVWHGEFSTRQEAFEFERKLKGWSRAKKEALIRDDWKMIHELARSRESQRRKTREKTIRSTTAVPNTEGPSTSGATRRSAHSSQGGAPSAQDERGSQTVK